MIRVAPDSSKPSNAACTFSFVSRSSPMRADSMTLTVLLRLLWFEDTMRFWDTSSG